MEDRFHLGSDTKAFTSLLASQFVKEGKLRWDSTLAEIFPSRMTRWIPNSQKHPAGVRALYASLLVAEASPPQLKWTD
jgi:CubicO group peptidase (beta-lactamase class C family)